jgi:hypothetical protein
MQNLILSLGSAVILGLGATLTFDLWALFLKRAFRVAPSNICLVGRWLRYMPGGTFSHAHIGSALPQPAECAVGWIAHYTIGILFAGAFVVLAGPSWLQNPTPIPAIAFGLVTALAPFVVMQPLMGLGWAASKTPNPTLARFRTLMNHAAFGVGLYLFAVLVNGLLRL